LTFQRYLALALSWAAVSWTAALLVVGLQPVHRGSPVLIAAVHGVGALVCHQRPERSFHSRGGRFPVCARCTGLYLSGAAGAVLGWLGLARSPRRTRLVVLSAAMPTALTLALEWLGLAGVSNQARALAALPLGGAAGWLFVRMLRAESSPTTCAMIA
jgi:uncharacterized membrane protein